jgi:hypothetical protein
MEPALPDLTAAPRQPADLPPPRLTALFRGPITLDADELAAVLRDRHPDLGDIRVALDGTALPGAPRGEVTWGRHRVGLAGLPAPLPSDRVEACVRQAHWPPAFKDAARRHNSHLLITYAGDEPDPLEQLVALALVGAALAPQGAWALLHEDARSCFPADLLWDELHADGAGDPLQVLRDLPLPWLYGGLVKYEVEGEPGVWMRTVGNHRFGLPDLARHAAGPHEGRETIDLFANLLAYLRETGATLSPGHTLNVGPDQFLRLREPAEAEYFLDSPGLMLVVEPIGADEIDPEMLREPSP